MNVFPSSQRYAKAITVMNIHPDIPRFLMALHLSSFLSVLISTSTHLHLSSSWSCIDLVSSNQRTDHI